VKSKLFLPKNKAKLGEAIKALRMAAQPEQRIHRVTWWVTRAYLGGVRRFLNFNYENGSIQTAYQNEAGQLGFRYEEVLTKLRAQHGVLMQADFGPAVKPRGRGIDSMRNASIGQVCLDYMCPEPLLQRLTYEVTLAFLQFGVVGIGAWVQPGVSGDLAKKIPQTPPMPCLEVIPPWELLPIPQDPAGPSELFGLIRERWVPLEWLEAMKGEDGKSITAGIKEDDMDVRSVPLGYVPSGASSRYEWAGVPGPSTASAGGNNGQVVPAQKFALLDEVWLQDDNKDVSRYIIQAGNAVLFDRDYEDDIDPPPMPIGVASDVGGAFYGRAYVEPLISINAELEALYASLFENVAELDNFGYLLIPTTSGIKRDNLEAGGKPKVLFFEPNHVSPTIKPEVLHPANSGTLPGVVAKQALEIMDRIASQSQMLQGGAPGRVDSARGLGFLFESSNIPTAGGMMALSNAFSQGYRAMLRAARDTWKDKSYGIKISALDNELAGIIIDPNSSDMKLDKNIVPNPRDVEISVRSLNPRSEEQEKMELQESLKAGAMSMTEYRIEVRKRGLSLPVGNEQEWQSYQEAVRENLVLFGDGATPGQIVVSTHDLVPVHIMVLQGFMASPYFRLASREVRQAFEDHLNMHMQQAGQYPDQLPMPEDMADAAQQQMGGMPGMGPQDVPQGGPGAPGPGMPQGMSMPQPSAAAAHAAMNEPI
jgi:hypothetical protein